MDEPKPAPDPSLPEAEDDGGITRRSLLIELIAAGAAGAGALAVARSAFAGKAAGGGKVRLPVLTADGRAVTVEADALGKMDRAPSHPDARRGDPGRKWIMVIDLAKCDGCGKCTEGCSRMHFIPPGRQWIKVLRMQDARYEAPYFLPQPCYHCDNPPCTKVCPVDATFKRRDGIVLIDNDRCIGCRFCMAACPYGARSFNWGPPPDPPAATARGYSPEWGYPRRIGTVEKCDFCPDMAARGELPACARICPMGVIYFGDQNEDAVSNGKGETVQLSKLLKEGAAYRQFEELGTEPRVYYLPPKGRIYPGPEAGESRES